MTILGEVQKKFVHLLPQQMIFMYFSHRSASAISGLRSINSLLFRAALSELSSSCSMLVDSNIRTTPAYSLREAGWSAYVDPEALAARGDYIKKNA